MIGEKIQRDLKDGLEREVLFDDTVKKYGWHVMSGNFFMDTQKHIDRTIIKNPYSLTVDVKKEKEVTLKYDCTWIEEANVHGNTGWLFAENLDAVAFQRKGKFLIVDILGLRYLYYTRVNRCERIYQKQRDVPEEIYLDTFLYKRYCGRQGLYNDGRERYDVTVLMPFEDIMKFVFLEFEI